MNRKTLLSLSIAAALMVSTAPSWASGSTSPTPCPDTNAIQAYSNSIYQTARNTYYDPNYVSDPAPLDGCISALSAFNVSLSSFSLSGMLDQAFQQAMQAACNMVNSQIQSVTNNAVSTINNSTGGLVSVGQGSGGVTVQPGNTSAITAPINNAIGSGINNAGNSAGSAVSKVFGQ